MKKETKKKIEEIEKFIDEVFSKINKRDSKRDQDRDKKRDKKRVKTERYEEQRLLTETLRKIIENRRLFTEKEITKLERDFLLIQNYYAMVLEKEWLKSPYS